VDIEKVLEIKTIKKDFSKIEKPFLGIE